MGSSGNLGKIRSVWKWIKHKVRPKRQDRKTDHKQDVWSMETEPAESKTIKVTIEKRDYTICGIDNVANVNFNVTYNNNVCKRCSRESHTNEWEKGVTLHIKKSYVGLGGNLGYESSNDNEEDNVEGPHCSLPENPFEKFYIGNLSRKLSNTIDISSDKLKDEKVMNIEPVAGMDHTSADYIDDNNVANSLPFPTLVKDQSNIKHYSGSPELESQNETEELMEEPTTLPKERVQSMCLQKEVEHMPIPDPVAWHEETQPKLTAADVNGIGSELKSFSFEVSSSYPVQTCSGRTEIKSATLAMYSDEGDSRPSTRFSPTVQEYALLSLTNNYKREPTSSSQNVGYCQEQDQHISTENISNKLDIMSEETTSEIDEYTDTIAPRQIEQRYTDHVGQFVCMFVSFFVIGRSMRSIYTTWCIGTAISKLMMKSNCEIGCVGDENVCNHQDQHQEEVENRNKYTYEGSKEKDIEDFLNPECLLHTDSSQSLHYRVKYSVTLPIERVECTSLENDDLCHDKLESKIKDNESEVAESINIGASKIETVHCKEDSDSGVARDNELDGLSEDMVVEEPKNNPMLSVTNNYKKEPPNSSVNVSYCQEQDQHISTENIRNEADISKETTCEISIDSRRDDTSSRRVDTSSNMPKMALQLYSGKSRDMIATNQVKVIVLQQLQQRFTDHIGQRVCRFVSFYVTGRSMRSIYTTWCIGTAISKLTMKSNCETGIVGDENVCNHQDQHEEEVDNRNKCTYEGSKKKDAEDFLNPECLLHTDSSQSLHNRVKYSVTLPIERVECTSLENDLCHDRLESTVKDNESEVAESINIGTTKIETVHCKEDSDSGVTRENDLDGLNEDTVVEERKEDTHELDSFTSEIKVVENVESNGSDKDTSSIVLCHQHLVISHTEKIDSNSGMAVCPENIKTLIEEVDVHKNGVCSIADRGKDPAEIDDLYQMFASITETTDDENLCNTHSHKMKVSEMPQNGAVEDDNHMIYGNDNSINKETEFDYDSERPGQGEKSRQKELASIGDQLKIVSSINPSGFMVKQCTKRTFDNECDDSVLPQPGERCGTNDKEEYQSDIFEVPQQIEVISLLELEDNRGSNSIRKTFIKKKNIDKQDIGVKSLGGTKCINDQEMLKLRISEIAIKELHKINMEFSNRLVQLQTRNRELNTGHNLCDLRKDIACIFSSESIQSQNESKQDTKVKLQKRKKRSSYFCKYCHHSRDKPNDKCFRHIPHPSSRTLEKEKVQTFEDGDEAVRSELEKTEPAVAYISSTHDSGVFSDFASTLSSYSQSYDNFMTHVKACCNTDKESTDAEKTSSKGLLLERRSLAERSLRDQEKKLKEILKAVTSSWSYFTPESFSPYLYPGLATYFERVQNGDQLSARERFSYEWIRFQSFDHYRGNGSGIILARNGFYHDRDAGETATRCYACDATCSDWEYFVDNAAQYHRPDCPHLNRANSRNIPIQPDDGSDERFYNTAASHAGRDNATATSGAAGRDDETTTTSAASDTSTTTGTVHNNYSVDTLSRSIEQARVQSQNNEHTQGGSSAQPTQDQENEQYMSSLTAHRENTADSVVTSSHTEHRSVTFTGQLTEPANLALPQDPLRTMVASVLVELGYPQDRIREAIMEVRRQTGTTDVTAEQVLIWILDDDDRRNAIAARRADPRRLETTGFVQTHPEQISIDNPRRGDYSTVDSRAASFTGTWMDPIDQTPRRMAEAGFFYTGKKDLTRCFACGVGLSEWELGDDPVLEHTRLSQNCPYVNSLKGEKYVKRVMQEQQKRDSDILEERKRDQQALSQQRAGTQSLQEEIEKLRNSRPTCKICLDQLVDVVFLPCGHLVCCGNCATKMRKCPICRKLIKGSVKVFMS